MEYRKNTKSKGFLGENEAVFYISQKGFTVLERNLKEINGEVDIIAFKDECFHFIEVKSSFRGEGSDNEGWFLEEKINSNKIKNINKVACLYLEKRGCENYSWCIDVISVLFSPKGEFLKIRMMDSVIL